ncbi:unnamed protein product [Ranitomeya imitator]|uniref:Reverse transcriptase domain-containing protein n=1 Tax=Ranitomeya imitator TaxID=111125 RepID=A0ABN9MHH6_9NEOB|nr:unnamed protein product [Ranitomeya imitator]
MELFTLLTKRMNLWNPQPIQGLKKSVSPADEAALKKHLEALQAIDVIKDSEELRPSPPAAKLPINKEFRFCLDYQHFKQQRIPDLYSDRNIQAGLNCLIGYEYYSLLAVDSRISQVPTFPGEREKPYSVRPLGFYECERMQPGYCQSLADYQAMMETVLHDMNRVKLLVHMDYIIVFGKTYAQHSKRLNEVMLRLAIKGITILLEKSFFNGSTVEYAGHVVYEGGITIEDSKREVLSKWPKPRTMSELQCYINFCSYYRQFVSSFKDLAEPLYQLLWEAPKHKAENPQGPWWTKESIEEQWTTDAACGSVSRLLCCDSSEGAMTRLMRAGAAL